jgi:hypothetical protein
MKVQEKYFEAIHFRKAVALYDESVNTGWPVAASPDR